MKSSKKDQRDGSRKRGSRGGNKGKSIPPLPPPKKALQETGVPVPRCAECGKKGHKPPDCWSIIGRPNRSNAGKGGNARKPLSQTLAKEQSSSGMVLVRQTKSKKRHQSGNPTGDTPDSKKQATSALAPPAATAKAPPKADKKEP